MEVTNRNKQLKTELHVLPEDKGNWTFLYADFLQKARIVPDVKN